MKTDLIKVNSTIHNPVNRYCQVFTYMNVYLSPFSFYDSRVNFSCIDLVKGSFAGTI